MKCLYNRQYFEGVGNIYRGYTYEEIYPWANVIAKSLNATIEAVTRVLDIGCAKGFLALAFVNLGIDAYGVDISSYAVSESPTEVRDRLHVCDIERGQLPFEDGFFDVVTMNEVIEHLHSFDHALKEVKRVLKPTGYIFITTPVNDDKSVKDTTHINVHPKIFWIDLFREFNLLEDAELQKKFHLEFKKRSRSLVHTSPPSSRIGYLLVKMGRPGQFIRSNLGSYIWRKGSHIFILRKGGFSEASCENHTLECI